MSQDQEHGIGLVRCLLDVLRNLIVVKRPLSELCPAKLHDGLYPEQREGVRHQWRHPPRVICSNDVGPTKAAAPQQYDGLEDVVHLFLLIDRWPPRPHQQCLFDQAPGEVQQGGGGVIL